MKKILKKIEWLFDYYVAYMMYNGNKRHKYYEYMNNKWNNKSK
jgi:hypothetical protein